MEDVSEPIVQEQQKQQPPVVNVGFDGFEKAEVAEMTESLLGRWVTGRQHPLVKVLPNPPTKLTGASSATLTVVVSKKGSYKS